MIAVPLSFLTHTGRHRRGLNAVRRQGISSLHGSGAHFLRFCRERRLQPKAAYLCRVSAEYFSRSQPYILSAPLY